MGSPENLIAKYHNEFEANRLNWNKNTHIHLQSEMYDVEGFKAGKTSLKFVELEEVGEVRGKELIHLQCHFGMDTLSWARAGATVTGIDLSDTSVELARTLAKELGIPATFLQSNVYELPRELDRAFDLVFTSYGAICWLPDLTQWAKSIRRLLKPSGAFYIVEFHPVVWMFDDAFQSIGYSYFNESVIVDDSHGTYADRAANIQQRAYCWNHSLADVISSLKKAGFSIDYLHEFPFSTWNCFENLKKIGADKWVHREYGTKLPYLFSIKASTL